MSAELSISRQSGDTLYVIIRRVSDNKVWQTTTSTFVTWNNSNVANYDVALTDQSGDFYSANFPSGITAGRYRANYYYQAGGSPATTDDLLKSESLYWNGSVVSASVNPQDCTIGRLVTVLRVAARNAGINDADDDVYDLTEKHLAIRDILDHFIRQTRCTRQVDTVTAEEDDQYVDFSVIPGFHPERILRTWIEDEAPIKVYDILEVNEQRRVCEEDGAPTMIAFDEPDSGILWPTPDADYDINVQWYPPLVPFAPGDDATETTDLIVNIPADMAYYAVRTGGVCLLQFNQIEHIPITNPLWTRYLSYVQQCRGAGFMGARSSQRKSAQEMNE